MTRIRPEAVLDDNLVTVEPGQLAHTMLTVRNTGDQIAEYDVAMVPECVAAGWTEAEPRTFRLMPGKDQQVVLRFQPPLDSSTPAGSFPYGVVVTPDETEHQAPVVAEGDLAIGAFYALEAELKPPRSRGRWRGRHSVKLLNRGSEDVRVKLGVPEEDEALSYALAPTTLTVSPGATAEAFLRVRPKSPLVMGKPVDHSFELTYRRRADSRSAASVGVGGVPSDGEVEAQVAGNFTQKPWISKLMLLLLALAVAGVALLFLWRPWEGPTPRRPPEPLENLQMISSEADKIVVAWDNSPNLSGVEIREVDCTTDEDVLPEATGDVTEVETSGSGRQSFTLEGFAGGEEHCMQARAVADGERSIWGPSPAAGVIVGGTLEPPTEVEAEYVGACTIEVNWTPVVPDASSELMYQVLLGREPAGEPVAEGGEQFGDQPENEEVEVAVMTVAGEDLESQPSAPVNVEVPEGCEDDPLREAGATEEDGGSEDGDGEDEGDGDGGGAVVGSDDEGGDGDGDGDGGGDDAGDGSGEGSGSGDLVRLEDRYWLLILQPAERMDENDFRLWHDQWQAFGADVGLFDASEGEDVQPTLGRVGANVALPETLGESASEEVLPVGTELFYVDLYVDSDEDEARAREDCAQLNRLWASFPSFQTFTPPCRLVHPDGGVDDVDPAPA